MLSFTGAIVPTERNFKSLKPKEGQAAVEFAFAFDKTGLVFDDGSVFYNYKDTNHYMFANLDDAFVYFFGDRNIRYQESFFVGDRSKHPTLDGWCKRLGIDIRADEDGSSVFSEWRVS